jgi:hypothetical protein
MSCDWGSGTRFGISDGALTWVRFLGIKDTFSDLPGDPQMGDAWGVKEGGQ